MRLLSLFTTLCFSYIVASSSDSLRKDHKKEAEIHSATRRIMLVIEQELNNATLDNKNSLSKRIHQSYPYVMNRYYPKAYNILKAGCSGNNPSLYRPAPGGGFFRPTTGPFYKRYQSIDYKVDGITENAKIIQKQLAVAWNKEFSKNYNSLSRRAVPQIPQRAVKGVYEAIPLPQRVRSNANPNAAKVAGAAEDAARENTRPNTANGAGAVDDTTRESIPSATGKETLPLPPADEVPFSQSLDHPNPTRQGLMWGSILKGMAAIIAGLLAIFFIVRALLTPMSPMPVGYPGPGGYPYNYDPDAYVTYG